MRAIIIAVSLLAILGNAFFSREAILADDVWQSFVTRTPASLRGLAAISNEGAWACGGNGTIVQTIDGGKSWLHHSLPNLKEVEIRSIHAWDSDQAIVATAGQPALILKTTDRGATWKTTYENKSPQAFFDGMRFWNDRSGIAFSDPVDGSLLIVTTEDGGESWKQIEPAAIPKMDNGEAGFAASNSSLHTMGNQLAWIGLGGGTEGPSRVFRSNNRGIHWTSYTISPIQRGPSSGIFSIAFENQLKGVAVGGDYNQATVDTQNVAISEDGGLNWRMPSSRPRGFRSSVVAIAAPQKLEGKNRSAVWIACGPSGCDWSPNREDWFALSNTGFHTLSVSPDGSIWAAGSGGRVARTSLLFAEKTR